MSAISCGDIMTEVLELVLPSATAEEAARRMRDAGIGFLPVCDDERHLLGVLTDRDIAVRVCATGRAPSETPVQDIMSRDIVGCSPSDPVSVAESLMAKNLKSRIVMIDDDGRLVGLISLVDLAQYEDPLAVARLVRQVGIREFRFGR